MKTGLAFEKLVDEVKRQSEVKQDYLVHAANLQMESHGHPPILRLLDNQGMDCIEPMEIYQTAHRQFGAYLGIPASYYGRMLEKDPDLLTANVNKWLALSEEPRLLRTLDGAARAFLSNRYWCVDHLELLQVVLPILGESQDMEIKDCGLTDSKMYIHVVSKRLREDVVPGDTVQYGFVIANSEIGMGAVVVHPMLFRLVCSNGMVSSKPLGNGKRRIHRGKSNELAGYVQEYQPIGVEKNAEFLTQLQDTMHDAITGAKFQMLVEQMRESRNAAIETEDLPGLLKAVGSNFGIQEKEQGGVLQHLLTDADMTLYGLANAVTRYAQDVESYDRSMHLQMIGYSVMTMPRRQWNHFNEMAVPLAAA